MNGRRPFITQHDNPLVPDELDRVLEREEVERYVARVRRGDFTPQQKQHWTDQFPKPQEGGSHWDMEKILANWAALYGAAPRATARHNHRCNCWNKDTCSVCEMCGVICSSRLAVTESSEPSLILDLPSAEMATTHCRRPPASRAPLSNLTGRC